MTTPAARAAFASVTRSVCADEFPLAAFRVLAERDDDDGRSAYAVGSAYALGNGVPRSDEEAIKWWKRGASKGHTRCSLKLGRLLRERGRDGDAVESAALLRSAARDWYRATMSDDVFTSTVGCREFGLMLLRGEVADMGDERSTFDAAITFLRRAAEGGDEVARDELNSALASADAKRKRAAPFAAAKATSSGALEMIANAAAATGVTITERTREVDGV